VNEVLETLEIGNLDFPGENGSMHCWGDLHREMGMPFEVH